MEEYTVEEIRDRLYPIYECDVCNHFDPELGRCNIGRRPRKYLMLNGPNEFCHAHFSCFKWRMCEMENESAIKEGIARYFAV